MSRDTIIGPEDSGHIKTFLDNKFYSVEFFFIPDVPGEEASISPFRYSSRPKPHPLPLSAAVTSLNVTSSIPVGDR